MVPPVLAAEFGLGTVVAVEPLAPGHPDVVKLTTSRGTFVLKPDRTDVVALEAAAAQALHQAGLRAAAPLRTRSGARLSRDGFAAREFLPGAACLDPQSHRSRAAQTVAAMRYVRRYHDAIRLTGGEPAATFFTTVADPEYLLDTLAERRGEPAVKVALDRVAASLPLFRALPKQLVHGDIGPDNVLMNGAEVVAIIDFTPHRQPVLFAVATAVYWYHVYGRGEPDAAEIAASLDAAGPWSPAELAAWPGMLSLEALRRYAIALHGQVAAGAGPRRDALTAVAATLSS